MLFRSDGYFEWIIYNKLADYKINLTISVNLKFKYTSYVYGEKIYYTPSISSVSVNSIDIDATDNSDKMFINCNIREVNYFKTFNNILKTDLNPSVTNARFITFDDEY